MFSSGCASPRASGRGPGSSRRAASDSSCDPRTRRRSSLGGDWETATAACSLFRPADEAQSSIHERLPAPGAGQDQLTPPPLFTRPDQGASRKLAPPVIARPVARAPLVASPRSEAWRPSVQPVAAPTFAGQGWDAEVQELLAQLTPTAETHEAVARVAQAVRAVVARVLPGAEVTSFVGASLTSGKAFGVAVPEVDVVISAPYAALVRNRWQGRQPGSGCSAQQLRKSAVRACTDRLVSDGGFRFRRSAFRGDEPRVTIVSSPALQSVPMNLSVNALTPLCNAMLIAECTRMDPRTQGLVLLVKRWAKDRGLCHVARGHMSLYSWTVLTVFFLQTGAGGLLPPLAGLETPSGLAVEGQPGFRAPTMTSNALPDLSVGDLFRAFFRFYGSEFDWRAESVSVRSGERGASGALPLLPVHIVVGDDGKTTEVGPSVEDPFDGTKNIGACTTAASLQHLHAARGTEQRRRSSSTQLALTFSRAARPHVLTTGRPSLAPASPASRIPSVRRRSGACATARPGRVSPQSVKPKKEEEEVSPSVAAWIAPGTPRVTNSIDV
ncbi:unnamed protein product [Prorocentrum cordatum]|uniref:PAP-associated domain-containing protein n=1 Tax=Prorocentrum cordatum TaxID=2364126 RepID=A0ABN9WS79_9DINO|nr:unnamed protein product [Polarella glacialis]